MIDSDDEPLRSSLFRRALLASIWVLVWTVVVLARSLPDAITERRALAIFWSIYFIMFGAVFTVGVALSSRASLDGERQIARALFFSTSAFYSLGMAIGLLDPLTGVMSLVIFVPPLVLMGRTGRFSLEMLSGALVFGPLIAIISLAALASLI
jgi:hypothetical protein